MHGVLAGWTPQDLHGDLAQHRLQMRWKYGLNKDIENRTHPYLLENWANLPDTEKAKDTVFIAVVNALCS